MMWPPGEPIDTERHYVRYRTGKTAGPPATAIAFTGTRTAIKMTSQFGASGNMANASEMIWFDIASNGGFVDISVDDVIRELETFFNFTVVGTNQEGPRLEIAVRAQQRAVAT